MKDGEKLLGMIIALMGASMGKYQTGLYGQQGDDSPGHVLQDQQVSELLELDRETEATRE